MSDLPSGTVALLFTDIEGSSTLWDNHRSAMASALVAHNHILREAITASGGVIVKDKGDGFFAAFSSADQAVAAALAAQRGVTAADWGDPIGEIRVRMAIHVGTVDGSTGDYHGPVVNRVARLEGIAHGGQVVMSDATRVLVEDTLPDGVTLRDLGAHTLRGMSRPERVFQLVADGLTADFPPLRVDSRPGIPLPDFPTSFVGREADEMAIIDLLADDSCRLVTLLGPGGIGKTRLGVETARAAATDYAGGAFFVDLTPVSASSDVAIAIAAALGARPEGNVSPIALAADQVTEPTLLVLDNFEHVQEASPLASELLRATNHLDLIATSRAPLRVRGERIFNVEPLASNGDNSSPAVALFYQRAAEHGVDLQRTGAEAEAVRDICRHLDGLPLAIELVAARTRLMGVTELAPMIRRSLDALGTGASDLPERQRTIRSTIDWSLRALTDVERGLFARLSVFPDGATFAQVEAIAPEIDTLGTLATLVDNSLVTVVSGLPGGTRYRQLVLLREYAGELLDAADARTETMERLVDHYIRIAPELGRRQRQSEEAIDEVDRDYNNLTATMQWVAETGYRADEMLDAQCELWVYWFNGDLVARALEWFTPLDAQVNTAKADWLAGLFELQRGDYAAAVPRLYAALERFTAEGDGFWRAMAQVFAGMLTEDTAAASEMLEEAHRYFAEPRDPVDGLMPRLVLSMKHAERGDWDAAIALRQELRDDFASIDYPVMDAWIDVNLAVALTASGRYEEARTVLLRGFELMVQVGNKEGLVNAAEIASTLAIATGETELGLRLVGGCSAFLDKLGVGHWPEMEMLFGPTIAALKQRIGDATYDRLVAGGSSLSIRDIEAMTRAFLEGDD